ncbi:MAG: tRNA (adenosine(37)-N6)-dimethylallyltransferase MiaA [Candidatus Pacebacteria bacterium]|nr:tRNA (adenosine(37)-N6)-dimethylallyltransferase MiaA [Candidatus Paceibacterota bacterium]
MSNLRPLIVILGPTSSGKTEMSLKLAKKYNSEIVNADSRQIYQEMNVGTGSPIISRWFHSPEGLWNQNATQKDSTYLIKSIPHHLFNIKKPNQKFSLSQYKKLAIKTINNIHNKNKTPILVGGTGLYISSITDNLLIPKASPNNSIRKKLEKHTEKYLYKRLEKIDIKSAETIGPTNKRKLIRALEVFELTGKPFSSQKTKGKSLFNILQIGIKTDREELYKKIDDRVNEMIKQGLIEETKKLSRKYKSDLPAMSGIGYFEIDSYLKKETSLEDAIQRIKFRTHQYARRQITWFKRDERIVWVKNYQESDKLIKDFLG